MAIKSIPSSSASCQQRIWNSALSYRGAAALVILSIFGLAMAYLWKRQPASSSVNLTRRNVQPTTQASSLSQPNPLPIVRLPEGEAAAITLGYGNFYRMLFPLHRRIESAYLDLPWPAQIQNIVVITQGGDGDRAIAARAIRVMQCIGPALNFTWVLSEEIQSCNPLTLLKDVNASKVQVMPYIHGQLPPGDFQLIGPYDNTEWNWAYIYSYLAREIPSWGFSYHDNESDGYDVGRDKCCYERIHPYIFPSRLFGNFPRFLPMRVYNDQDTFFNEVLPAALKRAAWHHCIPELTKIEGETLGQAFRDGLTRWTLTDQTSQITLQVAAMSDLKQRVRDAVHPFITSSA